jgi:hypothetical protein
MAKSDVPPKGSKKVAPSKKTGKVPPESKPGNAKSKEAGRKGAQKSGNMGFGKKK